MKRHLFAMPAMPLVLALLAIQTDPATAQSSERDALRASGQSAGPSSRDTTVPAGELVERAKIHDGNEVFFEGEAIGEPLARADHAWVNILGEGYAIGVWMSAQDSAAIDSFGSYASGGDRVAIRGIFHRACPEHGGDMDIHADSVSVVSRGKSRAHPIPAARLVTSLILLALAALIRHVWKRRESLLRREKRRVPE